MPEEEITSDVLTALQKRLEQEELEATDGVVAPDVYLQLLASYLHFHDLTNAKFLWKRIPTDIQMQTELAALWSVGQNMWKRDLKATHKSLQYAWTDSIKHIMVATADRIRQRTLNLVCNSYTLIKADELASLVNMSVNDLVTTITSMGWTYDTANQLIIPVKSKGEIASGDGLVKSGVNLADLTRLVSYLEN